MNKESNLPSRKTSKTGIELTSEPTDPSQNPDFLRSGHDIFHNITRVHEPESGDEESFRTWLKANTPSQSVPPSLLDRLKNIPNKE